MIQSHDRGNHRIAPRDELARPPFHTSDHPIQRAAYRSTFNLSLDLLDIDLIEVLLLLGDLQLSLSCNQL